MLEAPGTDVCLDLGWQPKPRGCGRLEASGTQMSASTPFPRARIQAGSTISAKEKTMGKGDNRQKNDKKNKKAKKSGKKPDSKSPEKKR
jgi:hypothetical protein